MGNRNYIAGRKFEYDTMRDYEALGYVCVRTSGSHGPFDVIAFDPKRKPNFIQAKRVSVASAAMLLMTRFKESTTPSPYYHQTLRVKIKGSKDDPFEVTV